MGRLFRFCIFHNFEHELTEPTLEEDRLILLCKYWIVSPSLTNSEIMRKQRFKERNKVKSREIQSGFDKSRQQISRNVENLNENLDGNSDENLFGWKFASLKVHDNRWWWRCDFYFFFSFPRILQQSRYAYNAYV